MDKYPCLVLLCARKKTFDNFLNPSLRRCFVRVAGHNWFTCLFWEILCQILEECDVDLFSSEEGKDISVSPSWRDDSGDVSELTPFCDISHWFSVEGWFFFCQFGVVNSMFVLL